MPTKGRRASRAGLGRWWWLLPLGVVALAAAGFLMWAGRAAPPDDAALAALVEGAEVNGWLVFDGDDAARDVGLIIYPGGRVDHRAYSVIAQSVADRGYPVVIVPMPLNLAVLAPERAHEVIDTFPDVKRWVLAGHSLGGAMAARFVRRNPEAVQGLVLWASFPAQSDDLSDYAGQVASIYGTRDGLATASEVEGTANLLPPTARWVRVEGANHAQFANYGPQRGDHQADITPQAQRQRVVQATVDVMAEVGR